MMSHKKQPRPIPVILDTDIGDDIDDTWALAMLLRSPELDLRLVTTTLRNPRHRAKIAARLLEVAGRPDIPIGIGLVTDDSVSRQQGWVEDYDLGSYPGTIREDGIQALIETIMASPEPITLICIGPLPNIQAALEREPAIARRARFVGMHGSLRKGYGGSGEPSAEWNVKADPPAAQAVFTAPWDMTITPLDTCGVVRLEGAKYQSVVNHGSPLARAVIENYRIWSEAAGRAGEFPTRSSTLYDTVAVYLAFSTELLVMEDLGVRVDDAGFTRIDPAARTVHCATAWKDKPAFEDLIAARVCSG